MKPCEASSSTRITGGAVTIGLALAIVVEAIMRFRVFSAALSAIDVPA
jgi:hypothetical protein